MSRPAPSRLETLWRSVVRALGGRKEFPRGSAADDAVLDALVAAEGNGRRIGWRNGQAEFKRRTVAMLRKWAAEQPYDHNRDTIDAVASAVEMMPV